MPKLSDTRRVILSNAAQHDALLAEPPARLPTAARQSVLRSLIAKGLLWRRSPRLAGTPPWAGGRTRTAPGSRRGLPLQAALRLASRRMVRRPPWRMTSRRIGTINELAASEKINSSYVSRVLRLTPLAPEIIGSILDGRQPTGKTLPALMGPFPVDLASQDVLTPDSDSPRRDPALHGSKARDRHRNLR
ncbi:hypothetical protein [Neoroseomonas rubea]|uniref:hypothetical protein n=1 Tax=Neoroseomonas rubea TaxID=2748666 RepID=UPI0018DF63FA|nr:hypothetical protein [Roseomonas rubea]